MEESEILNTREREKIREALNTRARKRKSSMQEEIRGSTEAFLCSRGKEREYVTPKRTRCEDESERRRGDGRRRTKDESKYKRKAK